MTTHDPAPDHRTSQHHESEADITSVALLCSQLVRHDSSVRGDLERPVAEFVSEQLSDLGLKPQILEREKHRSNVVARITGTEGGNDGLLVHIHLDVVPADAHAWTLHPFSGEISDGHVWGRGAVDMKDMAAMTMTALQELLSRGWRPRRDIVLAFVADEEMGGGVGARSLVEDHADLLEGCTQAIGEAGGFSYEFTPGRRAYLVQCAEKGIGWLKMTARGPGGHGSMMHSANPVSRLAEALARLERHNFPIMPSSGTRELIRAAKSWTGAGDAEAALAATGPLARLLLPTIRNTYQPTGLKAGLQQNVVPPLAEAVIDGRFVPGYEEDFYTDIKGLVSGLVDVERIFHNDALETPFQGTVPDAIVAALAHEDPDSMVVPACLPIGTDAKHFARLGINCYGFVPLQLQPDYDFPAMFHGVDERVPISALNFGTRVLSHFFRSC